MGSGGPIGTSAYTLLSILTERVYGACRSVEGILERNMLEDRWRRRLRGLVVDAQCEAELLRFPVRTCKSLQRLPTGISYVTPA